MARTADGRSALVEMKAVDAAYPLYRHGRDRSAPAARLAAGARAATFGAVVDPALLTRLDLEPGDRVTIGDATIELRAALDRRAGQARRRHRLRPAPPHQRGGAARDRAAAARQPGALELPAAAAAGRSQRSRASTVVESGQGAHCPEAGWEIRTRSNAAPQLERNIERFTQYLTLVGLTALLVGGVGVANAVAALSRPQARRDRAR